MSGPRTSDREALAAGLARLTDLAEIQQLVGHYLACLDEGVFDEARAESLFTGDIEMTFPVGSHRGISGVGAFTEAIMERWARTHHHGSDTSVSLDGDRAGLGWSLIASRIHHGSPLPPAPTEYFQLGGRFTGAVRRTPDGRRFERLRLRIVWTTGTVPAGVSRINATTLDTRGNTAADIPATKGS